MKTTSLLTALFVVPALVLLPSAGRAAGSFEGWSPNTGEELEFGVTSRVLGEEESAPWVFEGGYNGAYWFDSLNSVAQTFTVASNRSLDSVSARVSSDRDATGQFEIAIYEFNAATQRTGNRLAFATGDAASYRYGLTDVPTSTFDLSGFSKTLSAAQSYMLTFRGMENSTSNFYVQAATNIYEGGSVFQGRFLPSGSDLTGTWSLKHQGRQIAGTLRVENTGSEATEIGCSIDVHQSVDGVSPGKLLFSRKIPKRREAQFKNFVLRFRAPEGGYVIAVIDPKNRVAERDEQNNVVVLHTPSAP